MLKNLHVITGIIFALTIFCLLQVVTGGLFYSAVNNDRHNFQNSGLLNAQQESLSDSVQKYATSGDWRLVSMVDAGGSVTVASADRAVIVSETSIYGAVSKTNDAGAGIINNWAGTVLDDYRFTSRSGSRSRSRSRSGSGSDNPHANVHLHRPPHPRP